jgi:APA family basic amino acid/polyamine antiporter
VAAGAAVSCFGALNGWILLQGQLPLAAAVDGLLPRVFARVSPRGTPVAGLVISSVLVTLVVATNYTRGLVNEFAFIILLATLTTLVPYLFSTLTLVRQEAVSRQPSAVSAFAVPLLAFGYALWAIVGTGAETVFWGCVLLLAGVPVYAGLRRRGRGASSGGIGTTSPGA